MGALPDFYRVALFAGILSVLPAMQAAVVEEKCADSHIRVLPQRYPRPGSVSPRGSTNDIG
jgi:hypothetical protein